MRLPLARHRGSSRSRSPSPQAVLAQGNDPHGGSPGRLSPATAISGTVAHSAAPPCAAHHSRRFPLPPSLAGVLGRPCSGRWHGHRRTGDLKGVKTMTHETRESWLNAVAQGMALLFEALDAPCPTAYAWRSASPAEARRARRSVSAGTTDLARTGILKSSFART